jgi:hypothetical protein
MWRRGVGDWGLRICLLLIVGWVPGLGHVVPWWQMPLVSPQPQAATSSDEQLVITSHTAEQHDGRVHQGGRHRERRGVATAGKRGLVFTAG